MGLLRVNGLTKAFGGNIVVDGLTFAVEEGEVLGVVGPNGSGKTTLLNLLSGLLSPDRGEITVAGVSTLGLPPFRLARLGVVRTFQSARLFGGLTVIENLLAGASDEEESLTKALTGRWKGGDRLLREQASRAMDVVGLSSFEDRLAAELSLGQKRRVELGRVLMQRRAKLLLVDEPTGSLDPETVRTTVGLLENLAKQGTGIILVEHSTEVVRSLAHRVIVLDVGRAIAEGPADEVFKQPQVIEAYLGQGGLCASRSQ